MDTVDLYFTPPRIPAAIVAQDGRRLWRVRLLDNDGSDFQSPETHQLTGCNMAPDREFSDGAAQTSASEISVKLVARDDRTQSHIMLVEGRRVTSADLNADDEYDDILVYEFTLEPNGTCQPGSYEGQVGLFADNKLIRVWPIFVEVEPSLFTTQKDHGGITPWWVRTAIRDLGPTEESLLTENEFANYEIIQAIRRSIDQFNETRPRLSVRYTAENWPWRETLLQGVIAKLYETAAKGYLRDHLPIRGGGSVVAEDKNKYNQYMQYAQIHDQKWQSEFMAIKHELNAGSFYGTVG